MTVDEVSFNASERRGKCPTCQAEIFLDHPHICTTADREVEQYRGELRQLRLIDRMARQFLGAYDNGDLPEHLGVSELREACYDGRQRRPICDVFADVAEFHAKFNLPQVGQRLPHLLDEKAFKYRTNFLFEELREFIEAHGEGSLEKCADALADLVYVAVGTALFMHLPLEVVWAEVQRANMAKRPWREGDPIKARNGAGATIGFEIVKPEGWKPPDVGGAIYKVEKELEARGVRP